MKDSEKKKKLTTKIIWIAIAAVTVLNVLQITFVTETTKSRLHKDAIKKYTLLTEQTAMVNKNLIQTYLAEMDFYARDAIVETKDTKQIVAWMNKQRNRRPEMFEYIGYVDSQGNAFTDANETAQVSDRDYFKAIVNQGQDYYVDDPNIERTTGLTAMHVCKAVKVDGQNIGLFFGIIQPRLISKILDKVQLDDAGVAMIFGSNGYLIGTSADDDMAIKKDFEIMEGKYPDSYKLIKSTWGATTEIQGEIKNGSGVEQYFISVPLEGTSWNLMMVLNREKIFELTSVILKVLIVSVSIVSAVIIFLICGLVVVALKPLQTVESIINDIATGDADLTKRIDLKSSDNEIGRMVGGFNMFTEKLQTIVGTMKNSKDDLNQAGDLLKQCTDDTSDAITMILMNINNMDSNIAAQSNSVQETSGAMNQIASNIDSLRRMIENQVSAVTQASASVEEMIGNINAVNTTVKKMSGQFSVLEQNVIEGVKRQNDVNAKIGEISADSQMLQEANVVISSIAEQTNLLAMNAAIEAAHAGESGKGFSVVADEIRKLSEDATNQSQTIGKQLSKITGTIESIVEASRLASNAFTEVSNGIDSTNNLVKEITNAMEEQGAGSKQISAALNEMNDSSNEVKVASVEMAEGNKAILDEIKKLRDATLSMKSGMEQMNNGAGKISETGNALSSLSSKMESSIKNIGEQVDKFKV